MLSKATRTIVLAALEEERSRINKLSFGWRETSRTYQNYAAEIAEIDAIVAEVRAVEDAAPVAVPDEVRETIRAALENCAGILPHRQTALAWLEQATKGGDDAAHPA